MGRADSQATRRQTNIVHLCIVPTLYWPCRCHAFTGLCDVWISIILLQGAIWKNTHSSQAPSDWPHLQAKCSPSLPLCVFRYWYSNVIRIGVDHHCRSPVCCLLSGVGSVCVFLLVMVYLCCTSGVVDIDFIPTQHLDTDPPAPEISSRPNSSSAHIFTLSIVFLQSPSNCLLSRIQLITLYLLYLILCIRCFNIGFSVPSVM